MKEWLKKQATLQNSLSLLAILAVVFNGVKTPSLFVFRLSQATQENTQSITALAEQVKQLAANQAADRAAAEAERWNWRLLNELVAKEFPRRSELEPRLKSIEDKVNETNMTVRRMNENSRVPTYQRNP